MKIKNPSIKQILSGIGLGELRFGMTRDQIESVLGQPNEREKYSYDDLGDDFTENWHYDELELSLGFDQEEDWRLVTLAVTSKDFKYDKFIPIGLTKEQLSAELHNIVINDLDYEDWTTEESLSHELLSSKILGINFWFDEDSLTEVQWGPLLIDEETIDWPE